MVGLKEPNERQEGQEVRKGVSPYSAWPGRGVLKVPLKFSAIIHESTAPAPPSSSTAEGEKKPKWRTSRLGLEAQVPDRGKRGRVCDHAGDWCAVEMRKEGCGRSEGAGGGGGQGDR